MKFKRSIETHFIKSRLIKFRLQFIHVFWPNPLTEIQNLLFGLYCGFGLYSYMQGFNVNFELLYWLPFIALTSRDLLKAVIFILAFFAAYYFYKDGHQTTFSLYIDHPDNIQTITAFAGYLTAGFITIIAVLLPLGSNILLQASESLRDESVLEEYISPFHRSLKIEILVLAGLLCFSWLFPKHHVFYLYASFVAFFRILLRALDYSRYIITFVNIVIVIMRKDNFKDGKNYIDGKLK